MRDRRRSLRRLACCLSLAVAAAVTLAAEGARAQDFDQVSGGQVTFGPAEAILLRSTLAAINQANLANDYGIVRKLLTDGFAKAYPTTKLADLFQSWREKKRDFGFALIADPSFDRPPSVDPAGVMRLQGTVPTPSFRLAFDLSYRKQKGRWALDVLTLSDGSQTVSSETIKSVGSRGDVAMANPSSDSAQGDSEAPDPAPRATQTLASAVPDHLPPLPVPRPLHPR